MKIKSVLSATCIRLVASVALLALMIQVPACFLSHEKPGEPGAKAPNEGTAISSGSAGLNGGGGTAGGGNANGSVDPAGIIGNGAGTTDGYDSPGGGRPECGNGIIDHNEQCDGGNHDGVTCADLGFDRGTLICDPVACIYDVSECVAGPRCGDGVINSNERCDGWNLGGSTCSGLGFQGGTLGCNTVAELRKVPVRHPGAYRIADFAVRS